MSIRNKISNLDPRVLAAIIGAVAAIIVAIIGVSFDGCGKNGSPPNTQPNITIENNPVFDVQNNNNASNDSTTSQGQNIDCLKIKDELISLSKQCKNKGILLDSEDRVKKLELFYLSEKFEDYSNYSCDQIFNNLENIHSNIAKSKKVL